MYRQHLRTNEATCFKFSSNFSTLNELLEAQELKPCAIQWKISFLILSINALRVQAICFLKISA